VTFTFLADVSQSNLHKSHPNGKCQDVQLRMTHDVGKLDFSDQEVYN